MKPDPPPAPARTIRETLGFPDGLWRRYTAIHEAGHAVTAMTEPDTTFERSAVTETTAAGYTELSWTSARGIVVALHGGILAQERWLREHGLATPERTAATRAAAEHDFTQIGAYGFSPLQLRTARVGAQRLRDDHWPTILAVADILETQGVITAAGALLAHSRTLAKDTPAPTLLDPQHLARLHALGEQQRLRETQAETAAGTAGRPTPPASAPPPHQPVHLHHQHDHTPRTGRQPPSAGLG